MKRLSGILILFFLSINCFAQFTDYVNPFIGTTNFGTTNPGAIVPRGMVSVSPFNVSGSDLNTYDKDARWWSTPYSWDNSFLTGFSHVNLSGVGCPDLGVILLMPTIGEVNADHKEYGSILKNQVASPGYYATDLEKYGVKAELSSTKRTGISRYTFPKGKSNILLNLGLGLSNETGAKVRIVNNQEIEGSRMTGSFCYNDGSERPVYFVARFSKKAEEFGVWKKMPEMKAESAWSDTDGQFKYYKNYTQELFGDEIGAYFTFNTSTDEQIIAEVGVSYVSIANARMNLEAESNQFDFEKTRLQAKQEWNSTLSRVKVEGGTNDQKTIFYTALYHTQIHPNIINDVNGQYPAMESFEIRETNDCNRYTVFSLWDTYRNFHPLMALLYPQEQQDMVRSMVDMYKESGWLPKWELNSKETHVMEGDPAIPVIVDSYLRGLKDFDVEAAYSAMVKSATTPGKNNKLRPDIDHYLADGYVPLVEEFDNSVSHALEYYIADWNLAQFAKALDKKDDYKKFLNQSLRYKEYFDPKFGMFRPRLENGDFLKDFDPKQGENFEPSPGFHEGTAWQYAFCVPHDVKGLIQLMGGKSNFVNKLQSVFDDKLFDMANEPDIHYPYLFNYAKGEEWRTQKEVRRLIDTYYKNAPDGIPGNDDCGTLSAWIVYSMMGIYPVCPGNTDYAITSPVFDKISIELDPEFHKGKSFEILTHRKNKGDLFIDKMMINGKKQNSYFITHKTIIQGGELEFFLKNKKTTL
ncbi:GH92 family glycosyl hydrolase [Labilibaculum antarcticum]|uniref:Alpha-1,2-mannosidase n=1 Tax=Labilibaculum antarcticum TaxID=1717717 RepID=A0A1Y1CR01_9BACT|nr:GH92 family glycosyl hydrolase [Labilibaculum antarcticum]BAX82700.1 alpha-1,2-mannosidase [Labilibaculum antarcticum]